MPDINVVSTGTHGRGYTLFDREITEEQYKSALNNYNRVSAEDERAILTSTERLGYGASCSTVFEQDGKYYVHCHRWNNCD